MGDRDGRVVGAATVARNWVHPGQYSCAVDVHRAWRRQGVGRRLLDGVREVRPETLPLMSKLRPSNAAAMGFLAAAGGGVRQRSPGQVVDVDDHRVLAWAERHRAAAAHSGFPGLQTESLDRLDAEQLAQAFAEQYLWVHASWSPVPTGAPRRALESVAAATAAEADRGCSSGVWWNGRLIAMVLVFPAEVGWEVVAETVVRDVAAAGVPPQLTGVDVLRGALARTIAEVAGRGGGLLELDGHVDDPHLQSALDGLPLAQLRPLLLVQAP
nr:GNAT family N-acetyltransferase [Quadrisphaera sp. RL12-1S]